MPNSLRLTGVLFVLAVLLTGIQLISPPAEAASSSANYQVDESFIGPGGNLDSSSTNFKLESGQQSIGNTSVGESSSANFTTQSGATTTADPRLSCVINTSNLNFGALSTSVTTTGTATFSVLNYTAYGYNVSILGNPPNNGAKTLNGMSSTGPSTTGSEQFGINLKDNATPDIGAEAVQTPSGSFSFGAAASGYNTADNFRYVSGETIASAPKSSGQTDYTISYIINTATTTPGGTYSGNQTLLCTGTY